MSIVLNDGVYLCTRTARLKVLTTDKVLRTRYLDEGIFKKHPILRGIVPVVKEASMGWPFYRFELKNCEYLGEL